MMFGMVSSINDFIWEKAEDCFVPPAWKEGDSRIIYSVKFLANTTAGMVFTSLGISTGILTGVEKICRFVASLFYKKAVEPGFPALLDDSHLWTQIDVVKSLKEHPLGEGDPDLRIGVATCTAQDSPCPNSNWADWQTKVIRDPNNRSTALEVSLFELYKTAEGRSQIIDRLHKIGVNAYRFSVEQSLVNPAKGVWDEENIQVFVNLCKHLRSEGIRPMVTFDHFSRPKWVQEMGSFENEAVIPDFVEYCKKMFAPLTQDFQGSPLVDEFCTINEPAIDAFSGYVRGAFPPGKIFDFKRAGQFLKTAFKANNAVYDALKPMNPKVKIGITHQYLHFVPTNPLLVPITRYLTRLINDVPLEYFRTGIFELKVPFLCNMKEDLGPLKADFIGLQYYTRPVIGLTGPTSYGEPMTQMPFREDPAGFYKAILDTYNASKKELRITEMGISTHNDVQRARYLSRSLYTIREAQKEIGMKNLRAVYGWSFTDDIEWDMGRRPQAFGAYAIERNKIAENYKPGFQPFVDNARQRQISLSDVSVA